MKSQLAVDKSFTDKAKEFGAALSGAKSNLKRAGKLLVEMVEMNDDAFEILVNQYRVSFSFLESLELVGRGKLDPLLLTDPSPVAQRAVSNGLIPEEQKRLITTPVPVAVKCNGEIRIEHKRMSEITAHEACRVIRNGKITQPEEQIEVIKEMDRARVDRTLRYTIAGDGKIIRFHEGAEFDYAGLVELASKIAPKPEEIQESINKNQVAPMMLSESKPARRFWS